MDALDQLSMQGSVDELRHAVETVHEAELNDAPIQNGKQRNVDASKNTHFEFVFGGDDHPEVAVYIERYSPEPGIEVMVWADYDWFDGEGDYDVSPSDGDAPLGAFADDVLAIVADVIDADNTPQFEFVQNAPPSVVFNALFYL